MSELSACSSRGNCGLVGESHEDKRRARTEVQ